MDIALFYEQSNYWANLMHLVGVLRQFFPADDVPEIVDACMEYMTGPLSFRLIMGQVFMLLV